MPLSKSDFILASSCPKKLVYKKAGYPTANDTNEYLELLAKGGYVVGLYAQLLYDGIEVKGGSPDESAFETRRLLTENDEITLFEASFVAGHKVVRTDILQKKGNKLHIIEVKSKSFDSEDDPIKAAKKLKDYLMDLAYQTVVVKEAFPEFEVHSSMLLPDKSKRTDIEGLAGWFSIDEKKGIQGEIEELPSIGKSIFTKPDVRLLSIDQEDRQKKIEQLRTNPLLSLRPSDEEVNNLLAEVKTKTELFLDILENGIKPEHYCISKICRECEFHLGSSTDQNGYRECWGDLTDTDPHIFDLINGGHLRSGTHGTYLDELIANRKVSFSDLDPLRFQLKEGGYGSRGERQMLQYRHMLDQKEYVNPDLKKELDKLKYPLYFIDFETYLSALPHHKGMKPYEKICFQWSCHTLSSPDADLQHAEFLNDEYSFPNFRFAESLMEHIGDTGTPLMWSSYENTTLRDVLSQIDTFSYPDHKLRDWLFNMTSASKPKRDGRFTDLNAFCLKYYFHPHMKGKTSIKKVLPAIWNNNAWLREDPWFKEYKPDYESGLDPYDSLVKLMTDLEADEIVKDGTGAMWAYHDMMYGPSSKDPQKKSYLKQSLLNYCKLDTLAMVIIWKYWVNRSLGYGQGCQTGL